MAGDPWLQFVGHCRESGALVVLCGNEATRALRASVEWKTNCGDIVGDYKDIPRSTKMVLKTPQSKITVKKDPKEVVSYGK